MLMRNLYHFIQDHKVSMLLFSTVGALTAFLNIAAFTLLWKILALNYQLAVSIAYLIAIAFHFTVNRSLTFRSRGTNIFPQLKKYLTVTLGNYLITLCIVRITVETFHLSPYIGILSAIVTTVGTGYFAGKFWIFKASTE